MDPDTIRQKWLPTPEDQFSIPKIARALSMTIAPVIRVTSASVNILFGKKDFKKTNMSSRAAYEMSLPTEKKAAKVKPLNQFGFCTDAEYGSIIGTQKARQERPVLKPITIAIDTTSSMIIY